MVETGNGPFGLERVLTEEFALLHGVDAGDGKLATLYGKIHALVDAGDARSALCLSGGGIRSASFGLGVLQALARRKLLFKFHYLSTVSGGGYIGGWLSAWRKRVNDDTHVEHDLTSNIPDLYDEPPELAELRANSNYLTPKLGAMSADTWTLAALYIRNLLLNWLIFLPAIVCVLLAPILAYQVLGWAKEWEEVPHYCFAAAAILFLLIALTMSVFGRIEGAPIRVTQAQFLWFVLVPTYLGATLLLLPVVSEQYVPVGINLLPKWVTDPLLRFEISKQSAGEMAIYVRTGSGALVGAMLYTAAWIFAIVKTKLHPDPKLKECLPDQELKKSFPDPGLKKSFPNPELKKSLQWLLLLAAWMFAGAIAGCLVALGYSLIKYPANDTDRKLIVIMGSGWVALAMFLAESIYLGLTSRSTNGDVDREWLARSSGWFVASTLGWAALAALVLFAPAIVDQAWALWSVAAAGTGAGIAGSWIGGSAKTAATFAGKRVKNLSMNTILSLATMIFLAALAILISNILPDALCYLYTSIFYFPIPCFWAYPNELAIVTACMMVACIISVVVIARFVNVNRFSSHAIYRNRLIHAFLGAARAKTEKDPGAIRAVSKESPTRDPFTGFDAKDNLCMADLCAPTRRSQVRNPGCFTWSTWR